MVKRKKRATGDWPIVTAAAAFTVAEALVGMGVKLPGSENWPQSYRAIGYVLIIGGGFMFRWWATKRANQ